MRNSILMGVIIASAIMGGIIGGSIRDYQLQAEIDTAWDDITVVADGTLIPNPAAYAYDPRALASKKNVVIIDNRTAAIDAANTAVVETAFNN